MSQGESFQLAVAAPLKNHHFEFGQNYVAKLQSGISANAQYIKIDSEIYPKIENIIQYRDQILIGPSSSSVNKGETEQMPATGCQIDLNATGDPNKIFLLNKNNKFEYEAGDRISLYGTGLAGGWETPQSSLVGRACFQVQGIQRGVTSRIWWQTAVAAPPEIFPPQPGKYIYLNNGGRPLLWYGFGSNTNEYGFLLDIDETYGDRMKYVIVPVEVEEGFQYAKVAVSPGSYGATHKFLYGDYHKGGWRKQYAQKIAIRMDPNTPTGVFLRQNLVRSGTEDIRERSLIIPYQYYRIGGRVYYDTTYTTQPLQDTYTIYMVLRSHADRRNFAGQQESIVVDAMTGTSANKWHIFSTVGLLDSGLHKDYPPTLDFWFENSGIPSPYKGGLNMYIDDVFVEHAGGANYAHIDGCLDFGRYNVWPEHDSLKISKITRTGTTSLYGKKERTIVSFKLNYVSQEFWDQFELITEWMEKGFLLNLHPYINDIPLTLTGRLKIKDYVKDNWDLNLRSFTIEFTEE